MDDLCFSHTEIFISLALCHVETVMKASFFSFNSKFLLRWGNRTSKQLPGHHLLKYTVINFIFLHDI